MMTKGLIHKFPAYAVALKKAQSFVKPTSVFLGDDEKFWVPELVEDIPRLQRFGFQIATKDSRPVTKDHFPGFNAGGKRHPFLFHHLHRKHV